MFYLANISEKSYKCDLFCKKMHIINVLLPYFQKCTKENLSFCARKPNISTTEVNAYWLVGNYMVEYEQQGKGRSEYGKGVNEVACEYLLCNNLIYISYTQQNYSFG